MYLLVTSVVFVVQEERAEIKDKDEVIFSSDVIRYYFVVIIPLFSDQLTQYKTHILIRN
jgi:hypothetical protein